MVAAQYLLREHGQELELNGLFDTSTELATVMFQGSKGLDDDGLIGNLTWEAMIVVVRPGDEDRRAVRAVQDLLGSRYDIEVEIDGNLDEATEQGIRQVPARSPPERRGRHRGRGDLERLGGRREPLQPGRPPARAARRG